MRRALRLLAVTMIAAGGLLLADGIATLAWREPVTSVYAGAQQDKLDARLRVVERASARNVLRAGPRRPAAAPLPATPIGRLRVPAVGLRAVVVEGTAPAALRRAPGRYTDSAMPGARGTVASPGTGRPTARTSAGSASCAAAIGSSWRCPTDASSIASSGPRRAADGDVGHAAGVVRPPRPDRVPSAVVGGGEDRGVRTPRSC